MRKPGSKCPNLWTGSRNRKPEVVSKVSEMARNDAKFNVIRKIREKNHRGQTGNRFAKPEVVVYFGLLLV